MSHKPIILNDISLTVHQKTCFENFSTQIQAGKRIVIMGNNGAGKSTLLKIIQGTVLPTTGSVVIPKDILFGYVPQTIADYPHLSGGQRFNKALSHALSIDADILCLDEPTNHLDAHNKRSLIRMLQTYRGTLLLVSHDPEILSLDFDEIWHIEHGTITVFAGNYQEYLTVHNLQQQSAKQQREQLQKEKRKLSRMIQQEHKRAAHSKHAHKDETDRVLLGAMKERGSSSTGKNLKRFSETEDRIQQGLTTTIVHKRIDAKFNLDARKLSSTKCIVSVVNGSCKYRSTQKTILDDINVQLLATDRIAITGDNGTGKSTLIKALLQDPTIVTQGEWHMPQPPDIGYLDQHYSTLTPTMSAFEIIQHAAPTWSDADIQKHLHDFLFTTPPQMHNSVMNLSGGEKARLNLALIAAQTPTLLLLDEITNNIDLETRRHVVEVLRQYPGALIVVSHDTSFLQELHISTIYETKNGKFEVS